jgi:regulator of cell morphogenesis and NO signaling
MPFALATEGPSPCKQKDKPRKNMMLSGLPRTKLLDLAVQSGTAAPVLHRFGIPFYQFPEATLEEACRKRGLRLEVVVRRIEQAVEAQSLLHIDEWGRLQQGLPHSPGALPEFPLPVVVAYLQHTHGLFIRHQLPYMADMVAHIHESKFDQPELARDLKFVFPMFVQDFIRHIHEEEDTVFAHILHLHRAMRQAPRPSLAPLFYLLSKHSLQAFAEHHLEEDDEMLGIRQLTDNYRLDARSTPYTRVIYGALQQFERDLGVHAKVENDLLMPKAMRLEDEAIELLRRQARLN